MVHYLPFWHRWPQEALPGLDWAAANDGMAHKIAQAGQQLVKR